MSLDASHSMNSAVESLVSEDVVVCGGDRVKFSQSYSDSVVVFVSFVSLLSHSSSIHKSGSPLKSSYSDWHVVVDNARRTLLTMNKW